MFASGLLSVRYPNVSDISIQMTYYQQGVNHVLMVRTVNIVPTSYAYFFMDCLSRGCEGGGFDLASAVDGMVRGRKKVKKGGMACCGKVDSLDCDHARIDYEIAIRYL